MRYKIGTVVEKSHEKRRMTLFMKQNNNFKMTSFMNDGISIFYKYFICSIFTDINSLLPNIVLYSNVRSDITEAIGFQSVESTTYRYIFHSLF